MRARELLSEKIPRSLNDVAILVTRLHGQVDPGKIPMKQYLRRFATRLDKMKNEFRSRCNREIGSHD